MQGFRERTPVAAVERLLERCTALPAEALQPGAASDRVLAAPVTATASVPTFDRAAMDGYAVRAAETFGADASTPVSLRVIGTSLPGRCFEGHVGSGEAVSIMTGAPLPDGADAVLPVEQTEPEFDTPGEGSVTDRDPGRIQVRGTVTPGRHVAHAGEDVTAGSELLPAGRRLRPQDVAILLAARVERVSVVRQPRVDILATGNELVPAGETPGAHCIVDSSTPMLQALVTRDGGVPQARAIVRDGAELVRDALASCAGDVVLVTGGSSVGREDHVPRMLAELGELVVHGVALRPASPAGVGFLGGRPVFLLPGHPVSTLCAYDFFAGPTVRALGGRTRDWPYRRVTLPVARKITSVAGRTDYARVRVSESGVEPWVVSGASLLSSASRADGVVVVPHDDEGIPAGAMVTVHLYDL